MEASNKKLIVVLGMHRSGTSAITRGLRVMGVELGDRLIPPIDGNNAKGFWEDIDLNALNSEMLNAIDSDWCHLAAIDSIDLEILRKQGYFLRAVEMLRQKVGSAPVFGIKDPRVAKLLSFWKEVFSHCKFDVRYIMAVRNPLSVVMSLAKRDGLEAGQSYLLWLSHVITSLTGSTGDKRVLVDYDRLMQSSDGELMRIAKCIDLEIDPVELQNYKTEFLDQGLRHTVYGLNDLLLDNACPPIVREVYTVLLDVASDKAKIDDKELQNKVSRWSDEFERLKSPLMLADTLFTQKLIATQAVSERDSQIANLNEALAARERRSSDQLASVVSRLAQETSERAEAIASLNQAMNERDSLIASLNQTAGERNSQIAGLAQVVAERDNQIARLNQTASERNSQIAGLAQVVAERDDQIVSLNQAVAERDGQIASRNQAQAERDNQITGLNQSVADARRELAQVLASKSWRITKPLRFSRRVAVSKPYIATRRAFSGNSRALWRALPISHESKRSLKGMLFNTFPWIFRWSKAYQAWNAFNAPVNYSPMINAPDRQPGETEGEYVPLIKASPLEQKPAKLICFYLPQFHAIPENDEWWGEGFTEWTNVQAAQPQYAGHYQPHVPGELGYYNLLDPAVQRRQVELAKLYGIEGFCFYFYWFGGKRLLETPTENYLNDNSLDLPFCLCWANENWSRRWDGLDSEILIAQQHSANDDLAFIQHVSRYMRDPRYIRVNGKPLLLVYRPSLLPSAKETASRWRDWCRANGIGEIYLAYTQSFETVDPAKYGFDAAIEFPPNNSAPPNITDSVVRLGGDFGSTVYDWRVFVERSSHYKQPGYTLFRSVCPAWDNTARRKNRGSVFLNSTPTLYQRWLENAIRDTQVHRSNPDERLIFVNAWNEWAEGAHLEPDARYGYAVLESTRLALLRSKIAAQIDCGSNINTSRVAVVIHAYYPELLEEIIEFLRESDDLKLDLYVTTTADKVDAVKDVLERQPHNFEIIPVKNHGRDVLPFLHAVKLAVKNEHEIILKIHTKKSTHRDDGVIWRKDIYQKLLSRGSIKNALSLFKGNADLGILGPDGHIVKMGYYWGANAKAVEAISARLGVEKSDLMNLEFVAGTMFFVNTKALLPLLELGFTSDDFEPEAGQVDGTLAHAIERSFSVSAKSVNMTVSSFNNYNNSDEEYPFAARSH